jgi:hypothetical protein
VRERDAILGRILDLVATIVTRVEKLELAMIENAEWVAEAEAESAVAADEQAEINDLFAQRLGGRLVKVRPRVWPKLIVDNDNAGPPPEGAA